MQRGRRQDKERKLETNEDSDQKQRDTIGRGHVDILSNCRTVYPTDGVRSPCGLSFFEVLIWVCDLFISSLIMSIMPLLKNQLKPRGERQRHSEAAACSSACGHSKNIIKLLMALGEDGHFRTSSFSKERSFYLSFFSLSFLCFVAFTSCQPVGSGKSIAL